MKLFENIWPCTDKEEPKIVLTTVKIFLLFFCVFILVQLIIGYPKIVHAWDGVDLSTDSDISIDTGTRETIESTDLLAPATDIEIFDYNANESTDVEVQYIYPDTGGPVQVEVYDYATGEYSVLEMEIK
tara:strand:+ start:466 stop:852 length:387 start_codon:yes stop_codon:yes gene_type:complete